MAIKAERLQTIEIDQSAEKLVDLWREANDCRMVGMEREWKHLYKFLEVKMVFETGVGTLESVMDNVKDIMDYSGAYDEFVLFYGDLADRVLAKAEKDSYRAIEAEMLKLMVKEKIQSGSIRSATGRDGVERSKVEVELMQLLDSKDLDGAINVWKSEGGFSPTLLRYLVSYAICNGQQDRLRTEREVFQSQKVDWRGNFSIWNLEWSLVAISLAKRGVVALEEPEVLELLGGTGSLASPLSIYAGLARRHPDKTAFASAVFKRINMVIDRIKSGLRGDSDETCEVIEAILVWKGDFN